LAGPQAFGTVSCFEGWGVGRSGAVPLYQPESGSAVGLRAVLPAHAIAPLWEG